MHPVSIAICMPRLSYGGAEHVTVQVANELAKEAEISILTKDPRGPLRGRLAESIHVIPCRTSALWFTDVVTILRKIQPLLIFSIFWDLSVFLSIVRSFLPTHSKLILRESTSPSTHLFQTSHLAPFYFRLYRHCYRKADLVIAPSNGVAREIAVLCGDKPANVQIIDNCPDMTRLDGVSMKDSESLDRTIVSVGRLTRPKGFDLLIGAFKDSLFEQNGYSLKIFGEGEEEKALKALIGKLGLTDDVSLMGNRKDPLDFVRRSAAYVMPSRYEGLSNAMLEAICLGVPVVATVRNTSAEEAIKDGDNGILVKETDVQSIRDGLDKAHEMLNRFDRISIAENARGRFSSTVMLASYRRHFYNVLNGYR